MIARLIWFVTLIAIAVVTVSVQLDRQSRKSSAIAQYVPEPFRASAQTRIAAYAVDGDDPALGLAEAQKLVVRRPMPAEHLRILAQAQFAAGDLDGSALTIQYAAQRGWRDPLAQESMLRLASAAGDPVEAAKRYAALFVNRDTEDELLEQLGELVLAEPGGPARATLVDIVSGGDRWHRLFLERGSRVMPPDAFSEIVNSTTAKGVIFDCRNLATASRSLANRDAETAQELADSLPEQCPDISL